MAETKLKIQSFRTNDLVDSAGKQFELGKGWCEDFFGISKNVKEITLFLTFKALSIAHKELDGTKIELRLSEMNMRGDRKAYADEGIGCSQIKDFFIHKLNLTTPKNNSDYFAMYKVDSLHYYLYYVPELLYDNFIQLFKADVPQTSVERNNKHIETKNITNEYRSYITAIKSKPFLLLAGISGTGKSRIVRELARACWEEGSEEYKAQKPRNFEMVQVKPNWHDSSELIGYVSRVSGKAEFVAGDFLKFVAKAWEDPNTPYFLCLDEMNLAPVEQYFAEYLSVVESRNCGEDGVVTSDPILKKEDAEWYFNLTVAITSDDKVRERFNKDGICIPQNLIVVGTVNMDETTFSFSRKVLDRAMTIEMNDVNLQGGLTKRHESIGKLSNAELVGSAVEGVDVYKDYTKVCDTALGYLQKVNDVLEGTPFKIAYRTRNEFLLYVVNNLPYNKDKDGKDLPQGYVIARALDEITSMKIISRIEGDEAKINKDWLTKLCQTIVDGLNAITDEDHPVKSISVAKLEEMKNRLQSGYTSFWS